MLERSIEGTSTEPTDAADRRRLSLLRTGRSCSPPTAVERALVARVLAGEAPAFLELVERHHGSFVRLARAWGHGGAATEDVARRSWSSILEGLATRPSDRSLQTWMLSVVASIARVGSDALRADTAAIASDADDERFDAAGRWRGTPSAWSSCASGGPALERAMRDAVSSLPTLERVVFTLRDVEGLGPEEASAILGVPVSAQHELLHRARTGVATRLASRCEADDRLAMASAS
jgi:RNA polymerase sigma-70 factor, ECF subfamily